MKRNCLLLLLIFFWGCGNPPAEPVIDTGSRKALEQYYQNFLKQDWGNSYATLSPDQRKRMSLEQFSRLAQSQFKLLGFEPEEFHIRSCEEHGSEAIAHISLNGKASRNHQNFHDSLSLKNVDGAWYIVLPNNFGRKSR